MLANPFLFAGIFSNFAEEQLISNIMRIYSFLIILLIFLFCPSCTYLRETPSYREESDARKSPTTPSRSPSYSGNADKVFYEARSQKLGYPLNGNENPLLLDEVIAWLGTPYKYGGTTTFGVDCSGLAANVYRKVYNIDLERATVNMAQRTRKINRRQLKEGDLIFFKISNRKVSHVGIYISNNKFVHASTSRGVIISDITDEYYLKRFAFGGRVRK
jgi:murein DD-endopeptidase / murein LD-carboxypeptidase